MNDALALDAPHQADRLGLEQAGALALFGMAGAVQFSIAAAQILLAIALICWIALLVVRRERFEAPQLLLAAGWPTPRRRSCRRRLSPDPRTSLIDCKQLVLFLLVPLVYRFVTGARAAYAADGGGRPAPRSAPCSASSSTASCTTTTSGSGRRARSDTT